jgi:hypothetical protein
MKIVWIHPAADDWIMGFSENVGPFRVGVTELDFLEEGRVAVSTLITKGSVEISVDVFAMGKEGHMSEERELCPR